MPKEYKISYFKVSDFKDQNQNTWCDVAFEGVSEPAKIVVKDPSKFSVGMTVYGELKDATTKTGRPYLRFYRQQKPEQASSQANGSSYDGRGAKHGNALKIASEFLIARGVDKYQSEDAFVSDLESLTSRIFAIEIPEQAQGTTQLDVKQQATGSTSPELQSLASTYGKDVIAEVMDEPFAIGDIPF